jgi:hypothetical protein
MVAYVLIRGLALELGLVFFLIRILHISSLAPCGHLSTSACRLVLGSGVQVGGFEAGEFDASASAPVEVEGSNFLLVIGFVIHCRPPATPHICVIPREEQEWQDAYFPSPWRQSPE